VIRSLARPIRRLLRGAAYVGLVLLPLLLVVAASVIGLVRQDPLPSASAPAYAGELPAPPAHDPTKKTAVVLAGNALTEVSDLLGPYEVLAASGELNVYVVAPERKLTPLNPVPVYLCCAPVDLVAHYSFAEYGQRFGPPDLIVVPYIPLAAPGGADAAVLDFLRERRGPNTVVLSICGGAEMVADSGILAGHTSAIHHVTLPRIRESHPEVNWVDGVRYVDDGAFMSSAGVTSGVDAALYVLQKWFGRETALATAQRIGYPYTEFLDDRTWTVPADSNTAFLPNLFRLGRDKIGLYLYQGVDELAVSSITDTYPRAFATDVVVAATNRSVIRTRHGLDLIPRNTLAELTNVERVLIPGAPDSTSTATIERWGASTRIPVEQIHAGGGFAYDLTLEDMGRRETRLIAGNAARWIEYPTAHLDLGTSDWSLPMLLRPVGLIALGVGLTLALRRRASRLAPVVLGTPR
jgi:putative intracellular protease/amidase